MKVPTLCALGLLLLAAALMPSWHRSPASTPPEPPAVTRPATKAPVLREAPRTIESNPAPLEPEALGDVLRTIETAVTAYEPASVKVLQGLLVDPHPEVRTAAREAMVQLGEPDGVAALRHAARQLPAEEARACQEAADLLDLPSWSDTEEARDIVVRLQMGDPESSDDLPPPP